MYRFEDDVEVAQAAPATCSARKALLFALAGLVAAIFVLGLAMFHS